MKALVLNELKIMDVPEPKIGENPYEPYDFIAESKFCGICGGELRAWEQLKKGTRPPTAGSPKAMGHEFSGIVHDTGRKVKDLEVGDRITCETRVPGCGNCPLCRSTQDYICPHTEIKMWSGLTGGAATRYLALPAKRVHKIPKNVSMEEAAVTEPSSIAYHAMVDRGHVFAGESVAILGSGAIAILAAQIAKVHGASPVIMTGLNIDKWRLKVGKQLGADVVVNVEEEDLAKTVNDLTDGLGVDLAVEASGSNKAADQAVEIVRPGGRVVIFGGGFPKAPPSAWPLIGKEIEIRFSNGHTYNSWTKALKLISEGKIKVKPLISVMPLDDWEEAFESLHQRKTIKVLLQIE